jgi:hypothetical protein
VANKRFGLMKFFRAIPGIHLQFMREYVMPADEVGLRGGAAIRIGGRLVGEHFGRRANRGML